MRDWDEFLPIYLRDTEGPGGMNGDAFLALLGGHCSKGFTANFVRICGSIGLGETLSPAELKQLYAAAFLATLCCIAFNGAGGCGGEIKPDLESQRILLERDFMEARADLLRTAGWRGLDSEMRERVARIFFRVVVDDRNLAG